MQVTFPTRSGPNTKGPQMLGHPTEARPCRGHRSFITEDTCVWCGHYPQRIIRGTWEARAKVVAHR